MTSGVVGAVGGATCFQLRLSPLLRSSLRLSLTHSAGWLLASRAARALLTYHGWSQPQAHDREGTGGRGVKRNLSFKVELVTRAGQGGRE